MQLNIDTTQELTDLDRRILEVITGTGDGAPAPAKSESAPKRTRKAAAPKPEPEPEPAEDDDEPAEGEADEDLLGGDDAPTMDDAVALATKLVQGGKSAKVKTALKNAGAGRVSELKPTAIAGFVNELS